MIFKETSWKQQEKNNTLATGEETIRKKDSRFLMENNESQAEMAQ